MKSFLTATALIEGATGLALAIVPAWVVSILLNQTLTEPAGIIIGRLAGAALITLALACWLSGTHPNSSVMLKAMFLYNVFATILLLYAGVINHNAGPGLWPAIIIHLGMLIWGTMQWRKLRALA